MHDVITQAIMQSGSALGAWTVQDKHEMMDKFYEMAERLACLPWYHRLVPGAP